MANIYRTQSQIGAIRNFHIRGFNAQMLPAVSDVRRWFEGANKAKTDQGVFSRSILAYNQSQMELRGIAYNDALMQTASKSMTQDGFKG